MAYEKVSYGNKYKGVSTDVKPTGVPIDSTLEELTVATGEWKTYKTADGTNWYESSDDAITTVNKASSSAPAAAPVTVDTTAGGTVIAAANASRISITLQNVDVIPCLIRLGGDPSATAYNLILGKDSAAKAGDGGSITIRDYKGAIKGLTESSSTVIAVTEVV